MWSNKSPSEATRIGQYWDSVVTDGAIGSSANVAPDVDATLVETISRLERLDDARPASADFVRQFETQFLETIGASLAPPARMIADGAATPSADHHAEQGGRLVQFPVWASGRRRLLASIAAALLVFAAIGSVYFVVERREESPVARDINVIPAPPSRFDVPMDRGNPERSGVLPGPGVTDNLELRWNFEAGPGSISSPAYVGETLFVSGGSGIDANLGIPGSIIAIDAMTGDERWRAPTGHAAVVTPAVVEGLVYAADVGGILYALDAETGEEVWRQHLQSGWSSAAVVVDDTVFVAAAPYRVPLHVAVRGGTVVLGNGLVGQATDDVELYAFDRVTGEARWPSTDFLSGQPGLFGVDAENGALKWTFAMPSLESGPAISGQRVYAGSTLDGTIFAIDLATGSEIWRAPIGEDLPLNSSPAVSDGRVFITTAYGAIISLDESSGEERWRASAEHISLNNSAIIVDDTVYVVDTNFGVSALSITDGSVRWSEQIELTGQVVDSPVVLNGSLYIVTSLEGEAAHVAKLWVFAGSGRDDRDGGESS